jgi:hypothetical protein
MPLVAFKGRSFRPTNRREDPGCFRTLFSDGLIFGKQKEEKTGRNLVAHTNTYKTMFDVRQDDHWQTEDFKVYQVLLP